MPPVPGDQVVVGDIPVLRPGLLPRPALLTRLNRAYEGSSAVVLTGAQGAGKTQLAAAYARARLAGGWRLVAWVSARDNESLLAGLAAVAEAASLPDGGSGPGRVDPGQAVRRWLEADGSRCLLVFDDVADPGLLEPFVPATGATRVLIAMAGEAVAELGETVPVEVFSAEEALALLGGRTGLADDAGASAVAAGLGYLPLALDQAAAVIAGRHLGYATYLAELQALSAGDDLTGEQDGPDRPYPPGAAEAVLLSLEAARVADPLGVCAGLLETMAVLSPAPVRRDLLCAAGQAGTLLGRGRRVAASMVDQALERLNEQSLLGLGVDGQAITVHGLVARVVRGGLARRGRLATACEVAAAALEASAGALGTSPDHAAVRELLGQVTALLANAAPSAQDAGEELTGMLTPLRFLALDYLAELADAYHAAGRVVEAIPLLQRSLADQEQLFGADHSRTLATRNNLASAYRVVGQAAEAIPLFEENAAACERLLGADHPKTVASRHKLTLTRHEAEQAAVPLSAAIPLLDDPSPEPAPAPEPEPEPGTPEDISEPEPPAAAVAEAPPYEEPPAVPVTERPSVLVAEPAAILVTQPPADLIAEPPAPSLDRPARRRRRVPSLAAAIVVLLAAGGAAAALSLPHSGHGPATASRPAGGQPGSTASQLAAAWVARQVARSAIVACDPLMCSALEAQGVPAVNLLVLRTGTTSPLGAQVVVVTPAVRSQFGSRLDSAYAPSVIAGFGSGPDRVSVQVIARNGPTAYLTALHEDLAARKAAGAQLLANKQIRVSAEAAAQLGAGAVDSRLLIMLPALAAQHPIQILAFGQPAPGPGPGVPLCSADLSASGRAAGMTDARYLRWLTSFARAQLGSFAGSMAVLQQAGQPVVRVEFSQPSPLGLLASH